MKPRQARLVRQTTETQVELEVSVDGQGRCEAQTGIPFLDHMLNLLAHHARLDLVVRARGDLQVDDHHLVEDVGLVLGQAIREALGDKRGIERYGWALLPMDEVLVAAAVDLGGRSSFSSNYAPQRTKVGDLSTEMVTHFFLSVAGELRANLHLRFLAPVDNEHHRVEAMFKAFARALGAAVKLNPEVASQVPSTKGVL